LTMAEMRDVVARESSAWGELAQLMSDPLYWAPPRMGNGRAVLVLPGLFGSDLYLAPMRSWLKRAGYKSIRSDLWVNAGCPERLTRRTEAYLKRSIGSETPVAIIGHSRGGLLGRTIATRLQERVTHLILLGSPVGGVTRWAELSGYSTAPASTRIRAASESARRVLDPSCAVPECGCPFPNDFMRALHPSTRVTSIYSPDDPIVPARACRVPGAHNVSVGSTHVGLAFNVQVYRELGQVLRD
jgi:pimeloyl-ACP methyl ester carboxylesterase